LFEEALVTWRVQSGVKTGCTEELEESFSEYVKEDRV
jgi:hypothetical protein